MLEDIAGQDRIDKVITMLKIKFYLTNPELITESVYDCICNIHLNREKFNSFNEIEKDAYFYKTAHNILLSYIKIRTIAQRYENDVFQLFYSGESDEEYEAMWEIKYNSIEQTADFLTTEELEIIYWHYFFSFRFVEIAAKRGKPQATIRKQHERLIKKIKKYIVFQNN